MIAAHFVRVRRPQLALHFPDQVAELAARPHALQQRFVASVDRIPVHAGHVGNPELVALQSPHFAQHLPPFLPRLDRHPDAVEVDPAALARRLVGVASRITGPLGSAVCGNRAQPLALANDQRRVVRAQRKAVRPLDQRFGAQRGEIEHLEAARRLLVPAPPVRADDRQQRPDDLVALGPGDLAEAAFGDRKCRDALRNAVELNRRRRRIVVRLRLRRRLRLPSFGHRVERRAGPCRERNEVRPRRARKAQLELHAVVDRVERADRQEIEVTAIRIEGRAVVAKLGVGHHNAGAVCHVVELIAQWRREVENE